APGRAPVPEGKAQRHAPIPARSRQDDSFWNEFNTPRGVLASTPNPTGRRSSGRWGRTVERACIRRRVGLPPVVREGLVGLGHLVRVFALLHRVAAVVGGVDQLGRQLLVHRLLAALLG